MGTFIGGAAVGGSVGCGIGVSAYCCAKGPVPNETSGLVARAEAALFISPLVGLSAGGITAEVMCGSHGQESDKLV